MKTINATQLAYLMGINKKDAAKKLEVAFRKGIKNQNFPDDKNPAALISDLSEVMGIDFEFYIRDIQKNYLRNPSTGSYILNYPASKMKPSKTTGLMPKVISIPSVLRSFLKDETIKEIKDKWTERYRFEIEQHGIIFK